MSTLEKIKSELLQLELGKELRESLNILIAYFNNSSYFTYVGKSNGLLVYGYVDPEEDDKLKYLIYRVKDVDILIKITVYDFRRIIVSNIGINFKGYSLALNENSSEPIPEYKIVAA